MSHVGEVATSPLQLTWLSSVDAPWHLFVHDLSMIAGTHSSKGARDGRLTVQPVPHVRRVPGGNLFRMV